MDSEGSCGKDGKEKRRTKPRSDCHLVDLFSVGDVVNEKRPDVNRSAKITPLKWEIDIAVVEVAKRHLVRTGDNRRVKRAGQNELRRCKLVQNLCQSLARIGDGRPNYNVGAGRLQQMSVRFLLQKMWRANCLACGPYVLFGRM